MCCGVGRVVEAMSDLGIKNIDGVDISQSMIDHARQSPSLTRSRFWVTDGDAAGDPPGGSYDPAYSFICMNHISMRQTRIDIMRARARELKPGGTAGCEFL